MLTKIITDPLIIFFGTVFLLALPVNIWFYRRRRDMSQEQRDAEDMEVGHYPLFKKRRPTNAERGVPN